MKCIIISPEQNVVDEIKTVHLLFEEGLKIFHLRKPTFSEAEMVDYIQLINISFRNRVMIHSYHHLADQFNLMGVHYNSKTEAKVKNENQIRSKSCHSMDELQLYHTNYDYLFLSPIFNSISKNNYKSSFHKDDLININKSYSNIIALGGISKEFSESAKSLGFSGVATLGYIWNKEYVSNRVNNFKSISGAIL